MSDEMTCELCGEGIADGDAAEMGDPNGAPDESVLCHAECGLSRGMECA